MGAAHCTTANGKLYAAARAGAGSLAGTLGSTSAQLGANEKGFRILLIRKPVIWCGEGDLFSRTALKTRKLYTTQSSQNSRSARRTRLSHTVCHTARVLRHWNGCASPGSEQFLHSRNSPQD